MRNIEGLIVSPCFQTARNALPLRRARIRRCMLRKLTVRLCTTTIRLSHAASLLLLAIPKAIHKAPPAHRRSSRWQTNSRLQRSQLSKRQRPPRSSARCPHEQGPAARRPTSGQQSRKPTKAPPSKEPAPRCWICGPISAPVASGDQSTKT